MVRACHREASEGFSCCPSAAAVRRALLAEPGWHKPLAQLLAQAAEELDGGFSPARAIRAEVLGTAAAVVGALTRAAEDALAVKDATTAMRIDCDGSLLVLLLALLHLREIGGDCDWVRWRLCPLLLMGML